LKFSENRQFIEDSRKSSLRLKTIGKKALPTAEAVFESQDDQTRSYRVALGLIFIDEENVLEVLKPSEGFSRQIPKSSRARPSLTDYGAS
jgi:hypothetical protein